LCTRYPLQPCSTCHGLCRPLHSCRTALSVSQVLQVHRPDLRGCPFVVVRLGSWQRRCSGRWFWEVVRLCLVCCRCPLGLGSRRYHLADGPCRVLCPVELLGALAGGCWWCMSTLDLIRCWMPHAGSLASSAACMGAPCAVDGREATARPGRLLDHSMVLWRVLMPCAPAGRSWRPVCRWAQSHSLPTLRHGPAVAGVGFVRQCRLVQVTCLSWIVHWSNHNADGNLPGSSPFCLKPPAACCCCAAVGSQVLCRTHLPKASLQGWQGHGLAMLVLAWVRCCAAQPPAIGMLHREHRPHLLVRLASAEGCGRVMWTVLAGTVPVNLACRVQ
jgi:hypothetical protein